MFVEHGKEVGWQIQTWQEEPGRQPRPGRSVHAQFCQFFNFQGLEG